MNEDTEMTEKELREFILMALSVDNKTREKLYFMLKGITIAQEAQYNS